MSDLLESIKADLLDRRLLPVFALVALAFLGALGYAAFGGGSSAPAPTSAASSGTAKTPGIAVSEANASGAEPVAETTSGSSKQSGGRTRNPFTSLPSAKAASAAGTPAASSGSAAAAEASPGASSGGGGGTSSGGASTGPSSGSEPSGESKPSSSGGSAPNKKSAQQPKSQTAYQVSALFGTGAPGTPPQSAALTPYESLRRQQPLPSAAQGVVVFRGVIAGGKSATFTIVGEAIPRGSGACRPSASQCQAIDLQAGETEELEFLPADGPAVNYLLQVVSIKPVKAGSASVRHVLESESQAGLDLLRSFGLTALPGLRYSTTHKGVLVFAGHRAFAARAHLAVWGAAPRG
jgi:hypothetical protein